MSLTPALWLPLLIAERKELDQKIGICRELLIREGSSRRLQAKPSNAKAVPIAKPLNVIRRNALFKARKAFALQQQGWTYAQIARNMHISTSSVPALLGKWRRCLNYRHWRTVRSLHGDTWAVIS